jgi:predicted DNA-binding transcriptional regulator AlpA
MRELISEWIFRLNVPDEFVDRVLQVTLEKKNVLNALDLAAYALFRTCVEQHFMVSLPEIIAVSGASYKRIWTALKGELFHGTLAHRLIPPSALVRKYTAELNLTEKEIISLVTAVKLFDGYVSHSPKTIIVYVIYEQERQKLKKNIGIKELCEKVGISPTCLFRFRKKMKEAA